MRLELRTHLRAIEQGRDAVALRGCERASVPTMAAREGSGSPSPVIETTSKLATNRRVLFIMIVSRLWLKRMPA